MLVVVLIVVLIVERGSVMAIGSLRYDSAAMVEEVMGLVERIVTAVDPIAVIAFGSRARGEHRRESDLDLAVIVDGDDACHATLPAGLQNGISLSLDLLTVPQQRYERFRPWINTVHRQIDREGVRLYERGRQSADRSAYERLCA